MLQVPGRCSWSSWGCAQATIITLAILLLLYPVDGTMDNGISLLEGLKLHTNFSQYDGVTQTAGMSPGKPAYHLTQSNDRNLVLPPETYHEVVEILRHSSEFTLSAILRQQEANSGTIIAFSDGVNRYLELQSSGRRNEIRFHYTYFTSSGRQIHTETFPHRLADDKWHKITLSVSSNEIQLLIDCHPYYRRVTHYIPDRNFSASNMQLYVGQRNVDKHSLFKGDLEDVRIIPGPYGYIRQCPLVDSQCPTCGQFSLLQSTIVELTHNLMQLSERLVAAENRVSRLEDCDCKKSCISNGTEKADGTVWEVDCNECRCEHGVVSCGPKQCPPLTCTYPVRNEGECCPVCLSNCFLQNKDYEHGVNEVVKCTNCTCNNGNMICSRLQCPPLACSNKKQLAIPNECCKFCPGDDYCAKGHACHTNATCLNLNTKYTCTCRTGFQGDGFHCSDVDECAQEGGLSGNHCHMNTRCVNTHGSYVCECLPGYRRLTQFNCVEVDECATGQHECTGNSKCINTLGSYHCQCMDGYEGDGYNCKPVCNQSCLNGGKCVSPGNCSCRMGFTGISCEQDVDECVTGLHTCKNTADCVNMPGWYYCKCKPGYETRGTECIDIDECYHNTHSCHTSAKCVNTIGHFECQCPFDEGLECRQSCMFEDNEIPDGGTISPRNQPCKVCRCNKGVITCEEPTCNCSSWKKRSNRDLCCPQCDPKESCQHQELKHVVFRSGDKWIYQCQTCECLYGEFDCWKLECPPLTCKKPLPLAPGDCCPRCEDDPCTYFPNSTDISGKPCHYKGHSYMSGQSFSDSSSECTRCACKVPYCAQLVSNSACCVHRTVGCAVVSIIIALAMNRKIVKKFLQMIVLRIITVIINHRKQRPWRLGIIIWQKVVMAAMVVLQPSCRRHQQQRRQEEMAVETEAVAHHPQNIQPHNTNNNRQRQQLQQFNHQFIDEHPGKLVSNKFIINKKKTRRRKNCLFLIIFQFVFYIFKKNRETNNVLLILFLFKLTLKKYYIFFITVLLFYIIYKIILYK